MRELAVRVIACALAGAAILFLASSTKQRDDKALELYQHQVHSLIVISPSPLLRKSYPNIFFSLPKTRQQNLFTLNAEKIAHGLEEKNRINAEKVIVSYTREDKILEGFQKAVKERDEKFRNEVARVAKESAAEAAATHHYDNHGDPDDPKYDGNIPREITSNRPLKSRLEKVVEQKSEKVESHINHEVEEITGEEQPKSAGNKIGIHTIKKNGQMKNAVVTSIKHLKEKHSSVRDASEMQRYMDSKAFDEARSVAERRAEAVESNILKHDSKIENVEGSVTRKPSEISQPAESKMVDAIKSRSKPVANHQVKTLPENLKQYFDGAPQDLKDYMKSPAYLKIRAAAERQSEIYAEEHANRVSEKTVLRRPSIETIAKPAVVARSKAASAALHSRKIETETRPLSALSSHIAIAVAHRSALKGTHAKKSEPAGDDDKDEPEVPEEPQEEPDEDPPEEPEDVPTQGTPEGGGLGEENQVRRSSGFARQAPTIHGPGAASRGVIIEEGRLVKESKLSELRSYMNSQKFKQAEAEARARLQTASTLSVKK